MEARIDDDRRARSALLLSYGRLKLVFVKCRFLGAGQNRSKWCRTVLCVAHGEGSNVAVAVCYNRRMYSAFLSRCGRSKLVFAMYRFFGRRIK